MANFRLHWVDWPGRLKGLLVFLLKISPILYSVVMVGGLVYTKSVGENYWLSTALLYAPPGVFLAPLLLLIPATLIWDWKQCPLHVVTAIVVIHYFMEWKWGPGLDQNKSDFTVITNNVGQNNRTSFRSFQEKHHPDVILLQDIGGRVYQYQKTFPGYYAAASGEFGLLSRHRILDAKLVDELERPVAARFVIEVDGEEIVLYNVHLPTPRDALGLLRGNGLRYSILTGGGVFSSYARDQLQDFMDRSKRMAERIAASAEAESAPVILGGDFNAPAQGRIAKVFSDKFIDAHERKGWGCGFTIPGRTHNPFSLFGPFLRIDHIYSNTQLLPVGSEVEQDRPSQHRAVGAGFDLLWR